MSQPSFEASFHLGGACPTSCQEFARDGMIGYGDPYVDSQPGWFANKNGHRTWPVRLIADMGIPMPRILSS
ncbi:MAG: hypothetical protein COA99_11485 [Moraxellaceae bacterium]|nr:MAG: hypothetical protein COA99_11485 [Moraxellaceae bacterium]